MEGSIRALLDLYCEGYFTEEGENGGWAGASGLFVLLMEKIRRSLKREGRKGRSRRTEVEENGV